MSSICLCGDSPCHASMGGVPMCDTCFAAYEVVCKRGFLEGHRFRDKWMYYTKQEIKPIPYLRKWCQRFLRREQEYLIFRRSSLIFRIMRDSWLRQKYFYPSNDIDVEAFAGEY